MTGPVSALYILLAMGIVMAVGIHMQAIWLKRQDKECKDEE